MLNLNQSAQMLDIQLFIIFLDFTNQNGLKKKKEQQFCEKIYTFSEIRLLN